jgi:hypothetical protein
MEAGFKVGTLSFFSGDKLVGRASMESVASPHPYALMIPQADTERVLEERLES